MHSWNKFHYLLSQKVFVKTKTNVNVKPKVSLLKCKQNIKTNSAYLSMHLHRRAGHILTQK